jgi:SRSO17 transposase
MTPVARKQGGGAQETTCATKPQIALEQIRTAKAAAIPVGVVLDGGANSNDQ